jgi:hypothetical protein
MTLRADCLWQPGRKSLQSDSPEHPLGLGMHGVKGEDPPFDEGGGQHQLGGTDFMLLLLD